MIFLDQRHILKIYECHALSFSNCISTQNGTKKIYAVSPLSLVSCLLSGKTKLPVTLLSLLSDTYIPYLFIRRNFTKYTHYFL